MRQKGFTLVELMLVLFMVVGVIGMFGYGTIGCGNFWCTDSGVERQLKAEYPEIKEIVSLQRGVWAYTRVNAKTNEGVARTICLNSNLLFNYTFYNCDD